MAFKLHFDQSNITNLELNLTIEQIYISTKRHLTG